VERGKEQVVLLLDTLAQAVRLREPALIEPLLPPGMPQQQVEVMKEQLERTTWLQLYKGYTVDAEAAVKRVKWQRWREGAATVTVPGANSMGDHMVDVVSVVRVEDKWYIRNIGLARPMPGDAVEPPEEIMQAIRPLVRQTMADLRAGNAGPIHYRLPKGAQFRMPKRSWWQKITSAQEVGPIPILDDIRLVQRFSIHRWPGPDEPFYLAYLAPNRLTAFYDVPYDWPEGGINEPDIMRIEMTFQQDTEGWSLYILRLFGKAFLFS